MSGLLLCDITVYPYQFIVTVHEYHLVSSHSKEENTFSFLYYVVRYYWTCDEKTIRATNFCKTWFVQEKPIFEARSFSEFHIRTNALLYIIKYYSKMRMGTNRLPKQALRYRPKGRRNLGRPRKRWTDQIHLGN